MIAVLMPAYNEEKNNLATVIADVKRNAPKGAKILVVDDGSKDRTFEIAREAGAIAIRNPVNMGKMAAIKNGMRYIQKNFPEVDSVIFIDSDGQYSGREIPEFAKALKGADFVLGYRGRRSIPYFRHRLANDAIARLFNLLYGTGFHDMACGYRAVKMDLWRRMELRFTGYLVEVEMAYEALRHKARITEVPVSVEYRHKASVGKGVRMVGSILLHILIWRFLGKVI